MFKVQVQMMNGEWKDCGKLSDFVDGTWKTKEFDTESAARAAAIAAYPDHYPEGSNNATFRIVSYVEESKIKSFRAGEIDITVEFDPVYHEYVVRLFNNGAENRDAKYYTDDKEDALGTARHMFKAFLSADL